MDWDNPPVPWRELQRRMSWRTDAERTGGHRTQGQPVKGRSMPDQPTHDQPTYGRPTHGRPTHGRPTYDRPTHGREPGHRVSQSTESIPWAELHCHSSFSFLDGAATPSELVTEAARLGLEVLALTDHDGMYGVPQFAQAAARLRDQGVKLGTVFGAELSLGLPARAERPILKAVTCWCWPATRKGTGGCAR